MPKLSTLQKMNSSGKDFTNMSYTDLLDYGRREFNSASGFSSFKRQLLAFGVDFDAKKQEFNELKEACKPPATHELSLYTDYASKYDRFAITDGDGNGLWYGKLFDCAEQSAGEKAAVEKAIYLAGLARKEMGIASGCLQLTVFTDAEWLTYFNNGNNNKAASLKYEAVKAGVELFIEHIPGARNPADGLTRTTVKGSYCKAADNLDAVIKQVTPLSS
jgi:hypothetical protein